MCAARFATEDKVPALLPHLLMGFCKGNAMKSCRTCGVSQPLSSFYKHSRMADGHLNICQECTKARVLLHRVNNVERIREYDRSRSILPHRIALNTANTSSYRSRFKNRAAANSAVSRAVASGRLVKTCCIVCGETHVEGHHPDYSRPLDVVWLCAPHHHQIHLSVESRYLGSYDTQ